MTRRQAIGLHGFSWTTLFFGLFPALLRGHILAAVVMLIAAVCTGGISWLIFPFFYNSWHRSWLIKKGFEPIGHSYGTPTINIVNNVAHA